MLHLPNPQYLQAEFVVAVELQQAVSGGSGGRGQGVGSLHVDCSLTQSPLDAVCLVELLHLRRQERQRYCETAAAVQAVNKSLIPLDSEHDSN